MEEVIVLEEPPHGVPAVVVGIRDPRLTERFLRIANKLHPLDAGTHHLKRVRRRPQPASEGEAPRGGDDFSLELLLEGGESFRMRCETYLPTELAAGLCQPAAGEKGDGEAGGSLRGRGKALYGAFLGALAEEGTRGSEPPFRVVHVASHAPLQGPELWQRWNAVWPLSVPRPRPRAGPSAALTEAASARMREKVLAMAAATARGGGLLGIAAAVYDPAGGGWVADSAGCAAMRRDNRSACAAYVEPAGCPPASTGVVLEHPVICALKRASIAAAGKVACAPAEVAAQQPVPYLATNLDLYVSHEPCVMCAMALVHSRIARVFYCFPNKVAGGLGSVYAIHAIPSLNHHFRVYHCTKVEEECKDRHYLL